jgi:hypothetical protein
MARPIDSIAFDLPPAAGFADRAFAPLFDLSLLLTGPWAA